MRAARKLRRVRESNLRVGRIALDHPERAIPQDFERGSLSAADKRRFAHHRLEHGKQDERDGDGDERAKSNA